jgi:hypothetical protein
MPNKTTWIITTDGRRDLKDISADLATAGLTDGEVQHEIGVVIGKASHDTLAKLRKVKGVSDVSPDAPIDIGPGGSQQTW